MHVLLGAKTVFTAFSSPYRRTVMQLGATVMVGGFAPALLLMIGRPDLDPTLLQEPSVRGILSNTRDVTETHELAERLSYEASQDVLTGLANRALFHDRVRAACNAPGRTG